MLHVFDSHQTLPPFGLLLRQTTTTLWNFGNLNHRGFGLYLYRKSHQNPPFTLFPLLAGDFINT